METDSLTAFPTSPRTTSKPALVEGEPLIIDSRAPTTLTAALRRSAEAFPNRGIYFIRRDGEPLFESYAGLLQKASRVAGGFQGRGLRPGMTAILQCDELPMHFTAFWACLLGGVVPVTVAIAPTYREHNGVVDKLLNTWRLLDQPPIIATERLARTLADLKSVAPMETFNVINLQTLTPSTATVSFVESKPEDVAFLQLSSGSTGVPKCIQETHRGVIAHIHSSAQFNGYSAADVTLNWLPMDHVVPLLTFHVKDVYLGCDQIHAPTGLVLDEPLLWLEWLEKYRVTHTWSPNFGFKLVSDRLSRGGSKRRDLSRVKCFMNAGEQVTVPVVKDFLHAAAPFGVPESAMQPAFGMAEVCTCMTYANGFSLATGACRWLKSSLDDRLQPAADDGPAAVSFVSLGKVAPGIAIRITDAGNRLLQEREIGRLQIKGPVVTPGYFQNESANRDAFVGDGWFNTGDLGFIHDGELFLTGREKEMIIIRGAKFFCYEIEDIVNGIPGVEPTYVAACGVADAESGTETLAIFFAPAGVTDELNLIEAIRRRVTARSGIAPAAVIPLCKHQFPKTTSGKIQRGQLKKSLEAGAFQNLRRDAEVAASSAEGRAPRGELELRVADIWREVLGVRGISADAQLFSLGGDSLKATRIVSRIRGRWKLEFPLSLLFNGAATVKGMAGWIAANHDRSRDSEPVAIRPVTRGELLPLSCSQLRVWLAEQIQPGTSLYNICRSLVLQGSLDVAALDRALTEIVRRHEILRTIYAVEEPRQIALAEMPLPIPRHDFAHLPPEEQQRVSAGLIAHEVALPFDLATGPLLRARLIRLGSTEHVLVLTFHQIVTDAWSLGVFFRELAELYSSFAAGRESRLLPPTIQYADYAAWQQRSFSDAALEKQLGYWKSELSPPPPELRLDQPRVPENTSDAGAAQSLVLRKPLLDRLRAFNAGESVTLHMTLLAVYQLVLFHWTRAADVLIGSPESGRRRLETESLLGYFVNLLPLRGRLCPHDTFRAALARVRDTTLQAFANADVPFEKIVAAIPSARRADGGGLFSVWFGPIDSLQPFKLGEMQAVPRVHFPPAAQFQLSCFVAEQADAVRCLFEYQKERVPAAQMRQLPGHFEQLLAAAIESPDLPIQQLVERLPTGARSESTSSENPAWSQESKRA